MEQIQPNVWVREGPFVKLEASDLRSGIARVAEARESLFVKAIDTVRWVLVDANGQRVGVDPLEAVDQVFALVEDSTIQIRLNLYHQEVTSNLGLEMIPCHYLELAVDFDRKRFMAKISTVGLENAKAIADLLTKDMQLMNVDLPPDHHYLESYLLRFFAGHPHPDRNVFLIMRFGDDRALQEIAAVIRGVCAERGLNVLRADDKEYSDDLWDNVMTYMYGCASAIAVFDQINYREFNPNTALETGFMFARCRPVLLLKDKAIPSLPADLVGKIYKPFDTYNLEGTIPPHVEKWLHDHEINRSSE